MKTKAKAESKTPTEFQMSDLTRIGPIVITQTPDDFGGENLYFNYWCLNGIEKVGFIKF